MYTPEKNMIPKGQNISAFKPQQSNNVSPYQNLRGTPMADVMNAHPG